ncbi:unnamed protein product [Closterium sp. NIES-54]
MYALSASAEGDCYRCVPPNPGIAGAALDASESGNLPGTAPAEALHTFTLDSGASRCFFCDTTTLTPLPAPVPVRQAEPSGGPVVAHSSTVLPCPAVLSGSLSGLHLPSFSMNLRVSISTCTRAGSSLYTLATEPSPIAVLAQVSASRQVAASCSYRILSHQTLLWHHRLGHPSLPRLRGMHSRLLVSGLPRSLPPLQPSPAPPCLPCIEGRKRAAPHSSFPQITAPLQTLHMDVWGPARVRGQSRERYFLLVVDDYTRYTTVFPLRSKGQVVDVLIPWIRTVCLQLCECFSQDLLVLRVHSDRVRCASAQPLAPCLLAGDLAHTALDGGGVGDASVFRVWGSRAFVRDRSADKLSPRAILCEVMFDESVPFYRLFPYRSTPSPPPPLFFAPGPPPVDPLPPQGLAPSGVSQVDPLRGPVPIQVAVSSGAARGAVSGGAVSGGVELGGVGSEGAETGGDEPGGVGIGGAEPGVAEPEGVEPGGAASEGAESGGAEPQDADSSRGSACASPRLSPQQPREWFVRRARLWSGATRVGGAGVAGAGGAGVPAGASGAGGCCRDYPSAGGAGAAGAVVGGTGAVDPCAGGAGGTVRPRPYFVPLLEQPASPVPTPSPYTEQSRGLTERPLRPFSVPVRVPLPAPPVSSLPKVPNPESDHARAVSPAVSRLLSSAVADPSFEFVAASALVAALLEFAAACRLDYATALVAESASTSPPSVRDPDAPDIPTPRSYAEAITGTQWSLRRPVYGLRQVPREWQDTLRTTLAALGFAPSTADTSLFLRTDISLPPFYVLVYVDDLVFATANTEALTLVNTELQKRHTCTDLGELRSYLGLQITRDRARRTITLTPHMVHQVLQRFGFKFSSPQPTPLSTSHSLCLQTVCVCRGQQGARGAQDSRACVARRTAGRAVAAAARTVAAAARAEAAAARAVAAAAGAVAATARAVAAAARAVAATARAVAATARAVAATARAVVATARTVAAAARAVAAATRAVAAAAGAVAAAARAVAAAPGARVAHRAAGQ